MAGAAFGGRHILWLFRVYGAALFATCIAALMVPGQAGRVRPRHGEGIRFVLRDRAVVAFLLLVILAYGAFAAYNTFFALYLKGLGAGTGIVGISSGLATVSEIPAMTLAGMVMRRLGVKPVLLAGIAACLVRLLAYAAIHDYRLALLFQPLHGLCFAGFYVAGVTFMDRRVPARLRATGQTLFNVAFFGAGSVLGANLFGALYDHVHAPGMFLIAGLACVPALAGMVVFVPNAWPATSED